MSTPRERHPELYITPARESCRGKKKTVPLECLSLGFMRTGTFTMSAAMEILGLHCWHSMRFFTTNLGDCEMWQEVLDRKYVSAGPDVGREDFDQLFWNFGAIAADTPAIAFSEELIKDYPEAKVVLVERDIDKWWDPIIWVFVYLNPTFIGLMGWTHVKCIKGWMDAHNAQEMRQKAKAKYREHYALVRRITPKERLLEFKLEDGWEPLCKFLEKPVPDQPFPRINDREWLDEHMNIMVSLAAKRKARQFAPFVVPVLIGAFAWYWYRSHL